MPKKFLVALVTVLTGMKRLVAAALSAIVEVLRVIPGTQEYIVVIEMVAGFFGITGITHAGATGNLTTRKLATASAAVAVLIAVTYFVPALESFRPKLQTIAALLGSAAVGARMKEGEVKKNEKRGETDHDSL